MKPLTIWKWESISHLKISFEDFLLMLNLDMSTSIDLLCNKLTKPTLFLKREMKDIRTNAYIIKVAPLWEANTNTQFIIDPYVATS